MAVEIIEGGSIGPGYTNQQRSDKSAQKGELGEAGQENVLMPRFIYSKLGNLTNHKTITVEDMSTEVNEYKFFMMEMERLKELYDSGSPIPDDMKNIQALDEYLGSLGIDEIYPFSDDTYNTPPWLDAFTQAPYRNVISELEDINGNEQNVITNIDGTNYNVIHRT